MTLDLGRMEWQGRFWNDFALKYQEQSEDVAFVNIADVARALIKARNWAATLSETLVATSKEIGQVKKEVAKRIGIISKTEREVLSKQPTVPAAAIKTKELQKAYIRRVANQEERGLLDDLEDYIIELNLKLVDLQSEHDQLEIMRRSLEKTTEWLIQYLNWHKYEMRMLDE